MTTNNLFKRTGGDDFPTHLKVMVSGPPKSGKTTLLGTIPNLIVLDTEPNANNLASIAHLDVPYVTITNTDDLKQVLFMLKDPTLRKQIASQYGMPDVGGVAIDTLDSLQKLMKIERIKEQRATQFLRDDWAWLKTEMEAIVEGFTALPMHVIFTVHTKTKEMGKGDESYSVTLPGLEGSIAESIAGMVGYSLLSFRKEEIAPDGTPFTKYWLRTEGDGTHDFLGTRTGGRLPTIIEPNMKTIYDAVMAGRPKKADPVQQPALPQEQQPAAPESQEAAAQPQQAEPQAEVVAPTEGQVAETPAAPAPAQAASPTTDSDGRPSDDEPVNPAALGHVKRVYDSLGLGFPEDLVKALTIGEARELVKMWRAIQRDHAEGKAPVGMSPESEMQEYLTGQGLVGDTAPEEPKTVEPKLGGTIDEAMAYAQGDLAKVQETYEFELNNKGRKGLIEWCEKNGAKPPTAAPAPEPAQETSEPVSEPVTPAEASADVPPTEEEAQQAVEEGLGAVVIDKKLNADAPCDVCGKPLDDLDLAELGQKRFNKLLCVEDYLAELRK